MRVTHITRIVVQKGFSVSPMCCDIFAFTFVFGIDANDILVYFRRFVFVFVILFTHFCFTIFFFTLDVWCIVMDAK